MGCVAGIDDGYFERSWRETLLVLALHRWRGGVLCPCGLLASTVEVDGTDSTERAAGLVSEAARRCSLEAVLLDTVVYAGFNIVDAERLWRETGVPVVVVYWYPPDRGAVEEALRRHFPDWVERLRRLRDSWDRMFPVECGRGRLLLAPYGLSRSEAWGLACRLQLYTRQPEPLYTAHMAASMLSRMLSPLLRAGGLGAGR